jgi:hypothetical protein
MDVESTLTSIVDLFREIIYDILGLFIPGAALVVIVANSAFPALNELTEPITKLDGTKGVILFIGTSYVLGYALQGFVREIWAKVFRSETNVEEAGTKGVSLAGLQVRPKLLNSELFNAARAQLARHCNIEAPEKLSMNDVQNLAFAVASHRSIDASRFAYRADLSVGLALVMTIGVIITFAEFYKFAALDRWLIKLLIYAVLLVGFGFRAWFYFDIRGRIVIPIALAVLADRKKT